MVLTTAHRPRLGLPLCLVMSLAFVFGLVGCQGSGTASRSQPARATPTGDQPTANGRGDRTVPMTVRGGFSFVSVALNGRSAGVWLLDTGSNITLADSGVAGRLGLTSQGSARTTGIAGTAAIDEFGAHTLEMGNARVPINRLNGMSMGPLMRNLGGGIGGLLGFTAFTDSPFTIDQPNGQLILHLNGYTPREGDRPIPMRSLHGLPMIEARLANNRRLFLVMDTGADNELTLPTSVLRDWPETLASGHTGPSQSRGVGGINRGRQGWMERVEVLGVTLRDVPVVFQDEPIGLDTGVPVGRIGNGLLRRFILTFETDRRRLWAEFQPG